MENRLQPGQGNDAPRYALFALLTTLSILFIGIYWFNQPDALETRERPKVEPMGGKSLPNQVALRKEPEILLPPAKAQVAPKLSRPPVPARKAASVTRPARIVKSVSPSLIEAISQNDPDDAEEQGDDIAVLKDEKAANPQAVGTSIALSRRLMQAGRYAEAEQELRHVLQQKPEHSAARHQLGSVLAAQGKKEKALQEWKTLAETDDPTWSIIAQGAISRVTNPEETAVAVEETPIPDLRPARPVVAVE